MATEAEERMRRPWSGVLERFLSWVLQINFPWLVILGEDCATGHVTLRVLDTRVTALAI